MLIEISGLPRAVREQILAVRQGEVVQFADRGKVVWQGRAQNSLPEASQTGDSLMQTAGLWGGQDIDGMEYQERLRSEWVRGWEDK